MCFCHLNEWRNPMNRITLYKFTGRLFTHNAHRDLCKRCYTFSKLNPVNKLLHSNWKKRWKRQCIAFINGTWRGNKPKVMMSLSKYCDLMCQHTYTVHVTWITIVGSKMRRKLNLSWSWYIHIIMKSSFFLSLERRTMTIE